MDARRNELMKLIIDKEELQNFLAYLEYKAEECYYTEVHQAIEEFLNDHR